MRIIVITILVVVCIESTQSCILGRARSRRDGNNDRQVGRTGLFPSLSREDLQYLVELARSRFRNGRNGDDDDDLDIGASSGSRRGSGIGRGDDDDDVRGSSDSNRRNGVGRGDGRRGNGGVEDTGRRRGGQNNEAANIDDRRGNNGSGSNNSADRADSGNRGNVDDGNNGGDRQVQVV